MTRAPLRFLLTVLLLWVGARAAILLPDDPDNAMLIPAAAARPSGPIASGQTALPPPAAGVAAPRASPAATHPARPTPVQNPLIAAAADAPHPQPGLRPALVSQPATPVWREVVPPALTPALAGPPSWSGSSRWSLSAWLLVRREEGGAALAPGGTLGGGQAGARLTFTLGGRVALSGRAYLPLRRPAGAEVAAGLDWRPIPSIPLNLLAERRQRLGREGRSAFALTAYGGVSRNLAPRLRLDAYGQAGVVGLRSRDLFADGAVRLARTVGPVEVGAGAWGAAQPGASRLDAGPSLSWRLPVQGANIRLQADWRFRLVGDAAPRSGPALTLATDF